MLLIQFFNKTVPKYLQLFTGQPSIPETKSENEAPLVAQSEPVVKQPEPVQEVEAPKPVPEPIQKPIVPPKPLPEHKPEISQTLVENHSHSAHEDLNIVNKLIEKHESRIKESQSEVVQTSSKFMSHEHSSTNVVTKNGYNHVVEKQGSKCILMLNVPATVTHFSLNYAY